MIFTKSSNSNEKPNQILFSKKSGKIDGRSVCGTDNQISKKWFIIAIVVGCLIVIGLGGFGSTGLLQSHGIISLPKSIASIFNAMGDVSLWAMTVSGFVVGGLTIAWGAYKIHSIKKYAAPAFSKIPVDKKQIHHKSRTNDSQIDINNEYKILTASADKLETLEISTKEKDMNDHLQEIIQFNYGQPQANPPPQKFYHTKPLENLNSASIGDYSITDYKGSIKLLTIKDSNENLKIFVRESTRYPGLYRLIQNNPLKGCKESSLLYSLPQLAAMTRHAHTPQNHIRVSGFTDLVRIKSGLIIFTRDASEKEYYIVNRKGALEEVKEQNIKSLVTAIQNQ